MSRVELATILAQAQALVAGERGDSPLAQDYVAGDVVGDQWLPQFISPGDATSAVDRVTADADRLDQAIGRAGINMSDPAFYRNWFAWLTSWRNYAAEHRTAYFDAPNVYTYAEARGVDLRSWYAEAEARGARAGVTPSPQADEGGGSSFPLWGWAALGLGAAIIFMGPGFVLAPLAALAHRK